MSFILLLFLLIIQVCLNICAIPSNCSLSFRIRTLYQSHYIPTEFPIDFQANYHIKCHINHFLAYYEIKPFSTLVIDKYKHEDIKPLSMTVLNTTQFQFSINQSSTIRLCILLIDTTNQDYLCREIHITINHIYKFWNSSLKIFYICLICIISTYYIVNIIFNKCCCRRKHKSKSESSPFTETSLRKNDTFENEKIHSDEEDDLLDEE